jgi:hypothetical protein
VARQDQGRHGDHGGGDASGTTLGGAGAFEHGDLATATETVTKVAVVEC